MVSLIEVELNQKLQSIFKNGKGRILNPYEGHPDLKMPILGDEPSCDLLALEALGHSLRSQNKLYNGFFIILQ